MEHPLDIAIGGEIPCDLRGALLVFRSLHNRDDLFFDTLTVCISLVSPNFKVFHNRGLGDAAWSNPSRQTGMNGLAIDRCSIVLPFSVAGRSYPGNLGLTLACSISTSFLREARDGVRYGGGWEASPRDDQVCRRDAVPLAVEWWYDFPELGVIWESDWLIEEMRNGRRS